MDPIDEIIKDAEKYRSEEQYELALEKYTEAIASLYASRGEVFGTLERFENEIDDFTRALNLTTDAWLKRHLNFMLGLIHSHMGDCKEAILDLTAAIESSPTFEHFYLRGCAFEKLGDYRQARKDYMTALELYPAHEQAREALEGLDIKESKA